MVCDILDFRCILVNEIIGDTILAVLIFAILYFIVAGKLRFGLQTSMYLAVPIVLMFGIVVYGFTILYAFLTLVAAFLIAELVTKIVGIR